MDKKYDVVIFGATSFVGQILCQYMVEQFGVNGDELSWAIAARSESKLTKLIAELGDVAADLPVIIADAKNEEQLRAMCAQGRVIVTTVGPYALYGEPLVKICTETGTDYCDLTGEVQWIGRMIRKYETAAQASGARIVHCCGFDSIPSDLGVYFTQQAAQEKFGAPCVEIKMGVKALRGGFSGGTAASLMNVAKEATKDPAILKELANPYSICPPHHPFTVRQPSGTWPAYSKAFERWTGPFVMAAINTRIVHRSNALLGVAYTDKFTYEEVMMTGRGITGGAMATGMSVGMGGFLALAAIPPVRWGLEKYVIPAPGEGPSPEAQEKGFFDVRFVGKTAAGQTIRTKVTGDKDPGYGSTAKMLGQAGACLALDVSQEEKGGGFWTTASVFGETLIARLEKYSGLTFELLD